jgi:hypothetical protein
MRAYAAVSILFLAELSLSLLATPVEAAPSWSIQTVSNQTAVAGGNCPIAVDSNGTAHIAYIAFSNQTYSLIYASSNSPSWVSQTVDTGNLSRVFNLILDANGNPYILYNTDPVTDSGHSLKFASYDGKSWRIQNTGLYSDEADFQFDHLGNLHIAFVLGGNPLCYVNWTETALNIEIPDNTTVDIFNGLSLAFDSENSPFILYNASAAVFGSRNPRLAYILNSEWRYQFLSISGFVDSNGNLAVDAMDYRHAVFAVNNKIFFTSFYRSYYEGVMIVDNVTYDSIGGLCFDSQDNPHFCYTTQDRELVYVAYSNGTWNIQTVNSGSAFGRSYLALDASGNPHISYRTNSSTSNTANLMYATTTELIPENISFTSVMVVAAAVASAAVVSYVWKKRPSLKREK